MGSFLSQLKRWPAQASALRSAAEYFPQKRETLLQWAKEPASGASPATDTQPAEGVLCLSERRPREGCSEPSRRISADRRSQYKVLRASCGPSMRRWGMQRARVKQAAKPAEPSTQQPLQLAYLFPVAFAIELSLIYIHDQISSTQRKNCSVILDALT